jgi:hypothetical protein
MLHVTNGDNAGDILKRSGIPGRVLPWRDVLHEGPVPAGLSLNELSDVRARFIADRGWAGRSDVRQAFAARDATLEDSGVHEEVVLWFEHDLYDQLQLLQLLDWFADRSGIVARLSLICVGEYLSQLDESRLRSLYEGRGDIVATTLDLAKRAWTAFRSPNPEDIAALTRTDTSALPFVGAALIRHLEEFPSVDNGLSRSERQVLEAIDAGKRNLRELFFAAHHEREEPVFLGDSVFVSYLQRLGQVARPLVRVAGGGAIAEPRDSPERNYWNALVELTDDGRDVLAERRDWVKLNGIDRWLGGVHLIGTESEWRWDVGGSKLQRRARRVIRRGR